MDLPRPTRDQWQWVNPGKIEPGFYLVRGSFGEWPEAKYLSHTAPGSLWLPCLVIPIREDQVDAYNNMIANDREKSDKLMEIPSA